MNNPCKDLELNDQPIMTIPEALEYLKVLIEEDSRIEEYRAVLIKAETLLQHFTLLKAADQVLNDCKKRRQNENL